LLIKIDKLRLIAKLVSKLRIFNKTSRFNKKQTLNKTIESIKRTIDKNSNYERIVDKNVVNFLKERHLMRVSFS